MIYFWQKYATQGTNLLSFWSRWSRWSPSSWWSWYPLSIYKTYRWKAIKWQWVHWQYFWELIYHKPCTLATVINTSYLLKIGLCKLADKNVFPLTSLQISYIFSLNTSLQLYKINYGGLGLNNLAMYIQWPTDHIQRQKHSIL